LLALTHPNADPDALASAVGFKELCEKLWEGEGEVTLVFPQGVSRVSKRVMEKFGLNISYCEAPEIPADYIAMLDTSNLSELRIGTELRETILKDPKRLIVIDHHYPTEPNILANAFIALVDQGAYSTSLLIYKLFKTARELPSPLTASLLLAGIIYDTRRFVYSSEEVLRAAADILALGVNYGNVLEALRVEPEPSERIAKLKGLKRAKVYRVGTWLIATSKIGAFEASLARTLLEVGADVALVASEREEGVRLVARSTTKFFSSTKFSLGSHLIASLSKHIECSGGGHDTSAGMICKGDVEDLLYKAVKAIAGYLSDDIQELAD